MEIALIIVAFLGWLGLIVFVGKLCALTDETVPRPLERRPNVRLVARDEEDSAA